MARLTIGQKAIRVLKLLMGLRNARVASALAGHGFTKADLDEGWERLSGLTRKRLGVRIQIRDPQLIEALDAFENKWFPIVRLSLERHFPQIATLLFLNLSQTEGIEVAVSVRTLLERLSEMKEGAAPYGAEGPEAILLLVERGFTPERVAEAELMLELVGEFSDEPEPRVSPEEEQAAEDALWTWYLEWGGIARNVVSDRRLLRNLGFLQSRRSSDDDTDDDIEDGDVGEADGALTGEQAQA
jgi:hypothetical protein